MKGWRVAWRVLMRAGLICLALGMTGCATTSLQGRAPAEPSAESKPPLITPSTPQTVSGAKDGSDKTAEAVVLPSNEEESLAKVSPRELSYQGRLSTEAIPAAVAQQARREAAKMSDADKTVDIDMAFDAADLYQVLDATLYQLFEVNYIVDPSIKAKVTFRAKGSYTKPAFFKLLNDVLQVSGLALVPGPGDMVKVVRKDLGPGLSGAGIDDGAVEAGFVDVTRLIRLRYLGAETAAANIKPFLSPNAVVVPDKASNALVVTDTLTNIEKVAGVLAIMDMDRIQEVSWRIFPLRYAEASEVAQELTEILSKEGLFVRPGADSGGFQLFAIRSLNAVFLATRWPALIDQAARWLAVIDRPGEAGEGIYVYSVENGSAVELADVLSRVYGLSTSTSRTSRTAEGSPSLAGTRSSRSRSRTSSPLTGSTGAGLSTARPSASGASASGPTIPERSTVGAAGGALEGEVAFIPDEATNSIVIKAREKDYHIIRKVLEKLDQIPRQVLINVIIAELSLSGSVEYGIEWFLQGHYKDYTGQFVLDNARSRAVNTALETGTGFAAAVFDSTDFLRGLINALGKDTSLNILSSPNIMASDNKEAYIEVAEEIPIVTGEVTSQETTATSRTIQYRKTGIILKVTPHINSSGLVKMDISQEVSERGEKDPDLKTTSIVSRVAETSLVVQNGQTIVIGGLMRNRNSVSRSGIPGLRNLPLLKYVFGSEGKESSKTELIILITPRVVRDRKEAEMVTQEFSRKVEGLRELLRSRGGVVEENLKAPEPEGR
ncbi:type II secretion system secretin GspD [Desulfosoma caldarium]|uniref:General secretion pathway protein D n=1 Tax=Desulfosoma caldarium TaxID=610254 RepID=A0A3N1VJZ4_9BACT|nr:type II secretion system secretin GspD [Desulfosoma caldarium]ROR03133.1 general secretion pathway protein D [Desulfosoma caldarium]